MVKHRKKIAVVIPCYNEEEGIADVIRALPKKRLLAMGYSTDIIVIDNNSADRTVEKALLAGARVITEDKQGKGYALLTGFRSVPPDTDIVVMIDGDNTYSLSEIVRLIEPIDSDFCDVVIGTRMSGKILQGAMTDFNRMGNWMFTFLVRVAYQGNVTDVCSGYFAWDKRVIDSLLPHLRSNGFAIEMEMIAKMARMNYDIISVPITYSARQGSSTLNPFKDGMNIFSTWLSLLSWSPAAETFFSRLNRNKAARAIINLSKRVTAILVIFLLM